MLKRRAAPAEPSVSCPNTVRATPRLRHLAALSPTAGATHSRFHVPMHPVLVSVGSTDLALAVYIRVVTSGQILCKSSRA